jgi:peptide/nickel transport system permease protein
MAPVGMGRRMLGGTLGRLNPEPGSAVWYFRRDRIAMLSITVLVLMVLVAVFAPWLAPYPDQGRGTPNIATKLQPPSTDHPFGTDPLGRDMLARVMFGARTALIAGITIQVVATLFGTVLGAVAGYFGGWVDEAIMRVTDIFLAFPPLLLAMTIASVGEPSLRNTILAITMTWWPWYTRLVRGQVMSVREREYVKAARGVGVSDLKIIFRHVLPNVMTPILVQSTLDLGAAILTVSALSFVGLGVPPPTADWGAMVNEGRIYIQNGRWWVPTFPGLALFVTIMAFNLLGDGIQLAANPKARGMGSG